jgi:hypothetical protein
MSFWDQNDLNGFKTAEKSLIGQVTLDSELGKKLYDYAQDDNIKTFLEIGTWNGLGSTKCFIEGFKNRKASFKFYSLECNKEKSDYAKKLYSGIENVYILDHVLLNKIPSDIYDIFPVLLENETMNYWNKIDFQNMSDKKLFFETTPNLPEIFDLILLDGGEFTTWFEYNLIKDKCKILALDDTNTFKCKKIVEELKFSNRWEIINQSDERNGIMIWKNIKFDH